MQFGESTEEFENEIFGFSVCPSGNTSIALPVISRKLAGRSWVSLFDSRDNH